MKIDYPSEFIGFLNKENIYGGFLFNLERKRGKNITVTQYTSSKIKPTDYISMAFTWSNTKEGADYWMKINQLWIDVIQGKDKRQKPSNNNNSNIDRQEKCNHEWKPTQLLFSTVYDCSICGTKQEKEGK